MNQPATKDDCLNALRIDAFIAGAEKAGTTSLATYLAQHPGVFSHVRPDELGGTRVIEFSSFVDGRSDQAPSFEQDYLDAFGSPAPEGAMVLAKNVDIINHRDGALKLKAQSPDCKIIVSLRHPVDRAFSSFWYQQYRGEETCQIFEKVLAVEQDPNRRGELSRHRRYLQRGMYADHLAMLDEVFGAQNILGLVFEDLKSSPQKVVNQVFEFLGLPPCEVSDARARNQAKSVKSARMAQVIHQPNPLKDVARRLLSRNLRRTVKNWLRRSNATPQEKIAMDPATRQNLLEYFAPQVLRVEERLGRDLPHWKV